MEKCYLDPFLSCHLSVLFFFFFLLFSISGASVSGHSGNRTNLYSVVRKYKFKEEDGSVVKHHFLNV